MNMRSNALAPSSDYFTNHSSAAKWPFTIYHHPIEQSLVRTINRIAAIQPAAPGGASSSQTAAPRILAFGCGLFHERPVMPKGAEISLVDADERLESELIAMNLPDRHRFICARTPNELKTKTSGDYDLIYSKEVIEHIPLVTLKAYLSVLGSKLRKGGTLWLSTPNYGGLMLPLIENTFLEFIARTKGFSRRNIHPTKFSKESLSALLHDCGFRSVEIETSPLGLALLCSAKPL